LLDIDLALLIIYLAHSSLGSIEIANSTLVHPICTDIYSLLLLSRFHDQSFVNVRNDTTASDCSLDKSVELFVTSNCELQMSWGDSLNLKIFRGVTRQFKNLSSQILKDCCTVNGRCGSDPAVGANSALQESVNSSDWELKSSLGRS